MRALDDWGDDTIDAPGGYLKLRGGGGVRSVLPRAPREKRGEKPPRGGAPLGVAMALVDAAGAASGVSL